ncbi:5-formyltetrahydrofolate cyclo-ligase [Numidum massiliense]|uniref:5-formyltetrahydrofolate cyclo-ligase n=1 Tax=Numidum massiliense TaxID=1522315 RepID=UPI0006D54D8B|nr:5-formyltetrahydrofolate cyclo-ligase [Numidum massiliense]
MSKKEWRRDYLARRRQLPTALYEQYSEQICERMAATASFQAAKTVLLYMPIRQEVDVRPLIECAWQNGQVVYLPHANKETKQIECYRVNDLAELVPGVYGILEPPVQEERRGEGADIDLVVVPGIAFGRDGYRIGYGGGYYDRFLPTLAATAHAIGVAFSLQVAPQVPHNDYDQKLDGLVTERETLSFAN